MCWVQIGVYLLFLEEIPYLLSKESNKDRNNRNENHKEIHLGLQTVEIHPHTQLNSQKKAQALKELELFNRWF